MPAVMIKSWPSATSAPRAIFGSKRSEMYAVTRTRNTIRAVRALREIVPPHVGPTSVSLMSLAETPASFASAARRRSASGVVAWATGGGVGLAETLADALGVGAALALALAVAVGVGAAVPVGVGVGAALAPADADGVGEATAEALGVGAGDRRPSSVRLLLLTLTQPWGHCPPVRISTLASLSPNLFSTRV